MKRAVRRRYWFELGAAILSGVLCVLTLITSEWIEALSGLDPDGGSGAVEWLIVALLAIGALCAGGIARHERQRASLAAV